jgi:cadmium resistance protein CadD (predicted permease)
VDETLAVVAAAAGAFAGTNVDDLLVVAVLFTAGRATGRPRPWQVWAGQSAGIALLVAVSVLAALGLTVVPERWVGLLGLIPIALGVRGLAEAARSDDRAAGTVPTIATGVVAICAVTLANGADNVAVYTPMFRTMDASDGVLTVAVFAVLVAVLCAAGSWLGAHRHAVAVVRRWGHWLVPVVFVAVGGAVLAESL